ncbi:hypothetical protein ACH474_09535 [Nocardia rhamnosiphila]|uniref:Uncharacterized protein n=1 Tax=Nocardia rhamnosiphila TaxID=426716 RepID=A0ABV2WTP6_9NOCA|nr:MULTISPECIES: hypothetical protein [Nocardia]MCX0274458.1 hypothetical protein [Nocardia zapadnayensis]
MRIRYYRTGRHRLGAPGRVHCLTIPAVAAYLAKNRRPWLSLFTIAPRHSLAAHRPRPSMVWPRWVPVPAG